MGIFGNKKVKEKDITEIIQFGIIIITMRKY